MIAFCWYQLVKKLFIIKRSGSNYQLFVNCDGLCRLSECFWCNYIAKNNGIRSYCFFLLAACVHSVCFSHLLHTHSAINGYSFLLFCFLSIVWQWREIGYYKLSMLGNHGLKTKEFLRLYEPQLWIQACCAMVYFNVIGWYLSFTLRSR